MFVCVCGVLGQQQRFELGQASILRIRHVVCQYICVRRGEHGELDCVYELHTRSTCGQKSSQKNGEEEKEKKKKKKERTNLNCFRFTYFFTCFTLNCLLHLQLIFIFVESFPNLLAQQAATGNNNRSPWQAVATLAACNLLKSVAQLRAAALLPLLMPHMADLINYARGK